MNQYDLYPYPYTKNKTEYILKYESTSVFEVLKNNTKSKKLLVVGCGWFEATAAALHYPNVEVTGIDKSEKSLSIAREYKDYFKLSNLKLVEGDINITSFNEKFDCVVMTGVLHHIMKPRLTLTKINSILKSGGFIGGMVYSSKRKFLDSTIQKFRKNGWNDYNDIRHINNIINYLRDLDNDNKVKKWFLEHNLEVEEIVDTYMNSYYRTYNDSQLKKLFEKHNFFVYCDEKKEGKLCFLGYKRFDNES